MLSLVIKCINNYCLISLHGVQVGGTSKDLIKLNYSLEVGVCEKNLVWLIA